MSVREIEVQENGTLTISIDVLTETQGGQIPDLRDVTLSVAGMVEEGRRIYTASDRYGPYNLHPQSCVDWNDERGGDSDLGAPVVAPFAGVVINAEDYWGAWGHVVRVLGRKPDGRLVTWLGAHLDEVFVQPGDLVAAGDVVGTVGTAHGQYAAHLHEQFAVGAVPAPWTFPSDPRFTFASPIDFYRDHGVDPDLLAKVTQFGWEVMHDAAIDTLPARLLDPDRTVGRV